ncbi:MAG TPA: hypothetical protein VL284_03925 [Thermoanaerobaculia bacterium]|nr:hypothetical protein [Thermoanaerobaculia bacterium]
MSGIEPGASNKRALTIRIAVVCAALSLLGIMTANPLLTVAGLAVVPMMFALLWRPPEPPVLLFAASFQWLQVIMPVLTADRDGVPLRGWAIETAAWLGLATVVALAAGMRIGAGKRRLADSDLLEMETRRLNVRRLAWAYFLSFFVGEAALILGGFIPGLRQEFLSLVLLRWAVAFLVGWAALQRREFRLLAAIVIVTEVVLGFTGYFGGFKAILFLAIVLITGLGKRARVFTKPALAIACLAAIILASFWQVVKDDYRAVLSGGERAQVVRVPVTERLAFLFQQAGRTSFDDLRYGFNSALDRIGYLDYFALTIETVPVRVPYQYGRLWREALVHVLTPRFFFPSKAEINDSDRTREFTGVWAAGADEGTSISIGYAGESYIDFGPIGMFVPIVLLGVFWGWSYRWLATRTKARLFGLAVATNLLLGTAIYFEYSNIKLFGGALSSLIVLTVVLRYASDRMWRFVAPSSSPRPVVTTTHAAPTVAFGLAGGDSVRPS